MSNSVNSEMQNIFVGGGTGAAAVTVLQPMLYYKNEIQAGNKPKLILDPRILYRGGGGFAASFPPSIAIQNLFTGLFSKWMDPLPASAAAGGISASVVCPAELVMIQQQKTGKSFMKTAQAIYSQFGIKGFFRGAFPTVLREGVSSASIFSGVPAIKEQLLSQGWSEGPAQVVAGIIVGPFAATASISPDSLKTRMQRDFSFKPSVTKELFSTNALKGLGWRATIMSTAVTAIPFLKEKADAKIKELKS